MRMKNRVPQTFGEFRKVCNTFLQGMDPTEDIYYWNLWVDSRLTGEDEFGTFLDKIVNGEI